MVGLDTQNPRQKHLSDSIIQRGCDSIKSIPFLRKCKESVVHGLVERLSMRFEAPGEILARQGESCEYILLLGKGNVDVLTDGEKIGELSDGSVIGNPRALLGVASCKKWRHTVTSTSFCDFMVLARKDFMEVIATHPAEVRRIAKLLPKTKRDDAEEQQQSRTIPRPASPPKGVSTPRSSRSKSSTRQNGQPDSPKSPTPREGKARSLESSLPLGHRKLHNAFQVVQAVNALSGQGQDKDELPSPSRSLRSMRSERPYNVDQVEEETANLAMSSLSTFPDLKKEDLAAILSQVQRQSVAVFLEGIDLFSHLDTSSFERLLGLFEMRLWRRGEVLLEEGRPAKAMQVVCSGNVVIVKGDQVVAKLGPKAILGERSVISSYNDQEVPCAATVRVTGALACTVFITRNRVWELFKKDATLFQYLHHRLNIEEHKRGAASLKNIRLFSSASAEFIEALEEETRLCHKEAGEVLVQQGAACSEAVLLIDGSVDILKNNKHIVTLEVRQLQDAIIFGEFTLLNIWKAPKATVKAATRCSFQVIYADCLRRCLDRFPDESIIFRQLVESRADVAQEFQEDSVKKSKVAQVLQDTKAELYRQVQVRNNTSSVLEEAEKSSSDEDTLEFDRVHIENGAGASVDAVLGMEAEGGQQEMRQATNEADRLVLPQGLHEVKEFKCLPGGILKELESHMQRRLYMPHQVILRQGMDMSDVYILQRGKCGLDIFGADLEPMLGPSVIGGMPSVLTKKVFTTVIAQDACFVAKISKRNFATVFDRHPVARKTLFSAANRSFNKLLEEYEQGLLVPHALMQQLASMPFLAGASEAFLAKLAEAVEPQLLLPGQDVIETGQVEKQHSHEESQADLHFVFDGHFHLLQNGDVVGTVSPKMVFGVLEVFGIKDITKDIRIKSDEVCKVGTLTQKKLYTLLKSFPKERPKFEKLVHNILEGKVSMRVVRMPFFEGLSNQQMLKICAIVEQRLVLPHVTLVREGDTGDWMFILNVGKAGIFYKNMQVSMLWPGKAFGASQLMGINAKYHGTVNTMSTCHLLMINNQMLASLLHLSPDVSWVDRLQQRAKATLELEVQSYKRTHRIHRYMVTSGIVTTEDRPIMAVSLLLSSVLDEWHQVACKKSDHADALAAKAHAQLSACGSPRDSAAGDAVGAEPHLAPKESEVFSASFSGGTKVRPMRFSRALQRVDLRWSGDGKASTNKWKIESQFGRLDAWKGVTAPSWLQAVREEIPKHIKGLQEEARGAGIAVRSMRL
eukprot:TRINITY_DN78120_c0_g1_i1.p1 TRINITY_DN78120_c0_g1~~TRINITY_DN78120_c0_g1_i1.p1  ORF type:complete len:1254 (+),score=253.55 TRINITY_DN78120_c0_g1_i1:251-4012(+)